MKVFLSNTAGEQLHQIIDYLEIRWSAKVRDNFIDKLQKTMAIIALMPHSFPDSKHLPGLRKCVITSQTIAYYRINLADKEIEIIAISDARQKLF